MVSATAEVNLENLIRLQQAIPEAILEGIQTAGNMIVDLASQLAPYDSGDLSRSGQALLIGDTVEISFGNGLPDDRAIAQEYGTIYMPAQPYLGVAFKDIDVLEEVAKAVRARL